MQITEPTTMITDYLVAGLSVYFWWQLLQDARERQVKAESWWSWAFLATAVGAMAGGTSHGFTIYLGQLGWLIFWKLTIYSLAMASWCLLVATLISSFKGRTRVLLVVLASLKFVLYAGFMVRENDFDYVIYDYGSTMLIVLLLQLWCWMHRRTPAAPWIIGGIAVSFAASQIQMSEFTLHRHFNHNDLFHVVQMLGLALLYKGGRRLEDAT